MRAILLFICCAVTCFAQYVPPKGSYIEVRPDGRYLVITNTPDLWELHWSTDLVTWTPFLTKQSLKSLGTIELRLGEPTTNAPLQYWMLMVRTNYGYTFPESNLQRALRMATNSPPPLPLLRNRPLPQQGSAGGPVEQRPKLPPPIPPGVPLEVGMELIELKREIAEMRTMLATLKEQQESQWHSLMRSLGRSETPPSTREQRIENLLNEVRHLREDLKNK